MRPPKPSLRTRNRGGTLQNLGIDGGWPPARRSTGGFAGVLQHPCAHIRQIESASPRDHCIHGQTTTAPSTTGRDRQRAPCAVKTARPRMTLHVCFKTWKNAKNATVSVMRSKKWETKCKFNITDKRQCSGIITSGDECGPKKNHESTDSGPCMLHSRTRKNQTVVRRNDHKNRRTDNPKKRTS